MKKNKTTTFFLLFLTVLWGCVANDNDFNYDLGDNRTDENGGHTDSSNNPISGDTSINDPHDTYPNNNPGTGTIDNNTDTESDTVPEVLPFWPSWREPTSRQEGLAAFNVSCNSSVLTNECARNTPSPCVPSDYSVICDLRVNNDRGELEYEGKVAMRRRGRSSQMFHKPNYSIELRTPDGQENNPVNFMKMGKEQDWVLDGSWMDRSFMRNDIVFDIYKGLGPNRYAPDARYGELTFNGNHHGIYRLVEKIKRDDDRIDMPLDDGTGSRFVIKQHDDGVLSSNMGLDYSDWKMIYPNQNRATSAQRSGVQTWLNSFSSALTSNRAFDYLDIETTVDYVLMQEFSKNVDGFILSIHIYKDKDGLAHLVPWDFDLSFGQPTFQSSSAYSDYDQPYGWARTSSFIDNLKTNPEFLDKLAIRWHQMRSGPLSNEWLFMRIDDYQRTLNSSAISRNFSTWPISAVDFSFIYAPYTIYRVSDYSDEVSKLRQWIEQRLVWIDNNIESYGR